MLCQPRSEKRKDDYDGISQSGGVPGILPNLNMTDIPTYH